MPSFDRESTRWESTRPEWRSLMCVLLESSSPRGQPWSR
jgi:hypothetical protein